MLVDLQVITPYLLVLFTALVSGIGVYFKTVTHKLANVALQLAVLIEHNIKTDANIIELKKYHDELIELKVASSELDATTKGLMKQVDSIQSRIDNTQKI